MDSRLRGNDVSKEQHSFILPETPAMTEPRDVLIALTGWDAKRWQARFAKLLPDRKVFIDPETADPATVGYAATWKHKPGALVRFPNLKAIFSLGAGVDHLFLDHALPAVPMARVVD